VFSLESFFLLTEVAQNLELPFSMVQGKY
jgi:hypothetical protein